MNKEKNIVICGSMSFKDKIIEIKDILLTQGYNVLLPTECMEGLPKNIASRAHFKRIIDPDTTAILVINEPKNGHQNYIGPNTFAEVAFAFHFHKTIYLLHDIYEPYQDELIGWGSISLNNNLSKIK